MATQYTLSFSSERSLEPDELKSLLKKLTKSLQVNPFGPWKPGSKDHPELSDCTLYREMDPMLGYDKRWLVNALLDHLRVQENRIELAGINSETLKDLKFTLLRIDEFAGETVPSLDKLREIAERGVY